MKVGLAGVRGGIAADGSPNILEFAQTVEALGYDCMWFNEEHFGRPSRRSGHPFQPSPVILAAAVTAVTTTLRVGFSVLLVPLHNPLRLAEELATVDVLSRGRVNVGVSRANGKRYTLPFGYDPESGPTLEQCLDTIIGYWQGGPVHPGLDDVFEPRPVQKPHPPIYVGAYSDQSLVWAARRGFRLIQHGIQSPASIDRCISRYLDEGGDPVNLPIGRFCYVGDTDKTARADAWDVAVKQAETLRRVGLNDRVITSDDLEPRRFYNETAIIGGPETVAGRILELHERYGTHYVNLLASFFGHMPQEQLLASLRRFSEHVMPMLTRAGAESSDDSLSPAGPSGHAPQLIDVDQLRARNAG